MYIGEPALHPDYSRKISSLRGPILVLGASGFVGANLFKMLLRERSDVYGTAFALPAWRLEGVPKKNVLSVDLLVPKSLDTLMRELQPGTVFDLVAFGAYSFEKDVARHLRNEYQFQGAAAGIAGRDEGPLLHSCRQFLGIWRAGKCASGRYGVIAQQPLFGHQIGNVRFALLRGEKFRLPVR